MDAYDREMDRLDREFARERRLAMPIRTYAAIDSEGNVLLKRRGKVGAAQSVIDALFEHRGAIAAASGRLYGDPMREGGITIDGVIYEPVAGFYNAEEVAAA